MEKETGKQVAIIGAGPAGIVALKTVKEYQHHATCFEKETSFGGLWNISGRMKCIPYETLENKQYGICPGYCSLVMNTCTNITEFSDFPHEQTLEFLTHSEYLKYLGQYISHFDILQYIKFNTTVTNLEKKDKGWLVKYMSGNSGEQEQVDRFDYVIIATGPFRFPRFPDVKSLDSFPGQVLHSGQVRNEALLFTNKNVLVVGSGDTGMELTSAALKVGAKRVYLSVTESDEQRTYFMGQRHLPDPRQNGRLVPFDAYFICWQQRDRGEEGMQDFMKLWSNPVKTCTPSDRVYQVPKDGLACTHVDLINEMKAKGIYIKVGGVANITGKRIELDDNEVLTDVDIIVFATGYKSRYPALNGIWPVDEQEKCELYQHIVSPDSNKDGLILLDTTNSLSGSLMSVMEMQARYTCEKILSREYNAKGELFTEAEREQMQKEIKEERMFNLTFNRPFTYMVDIPGYNLKLAKEIGCDPPYGKSLLQPGNSEENIEFGVALYYGPLISAQYRVSGSRCWDGAKQHIIDIAKSMLGQHFDELVKKHSMGTS